MQEHTIQIGEVFVIDGVRIKVLAVVGSEVYVAIGDPLPTSGETSTIVVMRSPEAWMNPSTN